MIYYPGYSFLWVSSGTFDVAEFVLQAEKTLGNMYATVYWRKGYLSEDASVYGSESQA